MRILLTGHTGLVGRHLHALLKNSRNIDEIAVLTESDFESFQAALNAIQGNFHIVFHIGAVANPQEQSTRLWQMNVAATQLLLEKTVWNDNRFVFLSSYSIYEPDTDYAWSKLTAERIARSYIDPNKLCILRPVSIWGGDESEKETPSILYKLRKKQLKYLYDNWYRDFVHVQDVVEYIGSLATYWEPGTWDIGTGEVFPCSDLVKYADYFCLTKEELPEIISHEKESRRVADKAYAPPNWAPTRLLLQEMQSFCEKK